MNFLYSTSFFFSFSFSCFCFNYFPYLACCLWAITMDAFFFLLYSSLFCCFFCTLPVRGAVCFPPNCSTRTPTDTLMTTALCASPAARMRRGRDERRAEGAVTCGRATRACGAEHTFLSLLFCFLAARAGRHPQRHTHSHTLPPCCFVLLFVCISRAGSPFAVGLVSISLPSDDFFLLLRSLSRCRDATLVMSACLSQPPHTHE
ncbi:ATPase, putative [Trypanosoma cruzi]|uniref:ATPase, putative n=1 Tax=Trypanosoma cruzi (strain CL Brener) TaxID=353153 RepID=Q4DWB0_TRYCC|nr:ATPase, putative [Trypanosoma cruzi]EAN96810.1 ATPase, putative [Trypanosoma cruzi]|eukprot:XP_818661.1 ATPase [Trypanosoma cruzi strain CL Brener]